MGLFSSPSPFDQYVERATSEKNTGEDWALIMDLCDRVKEGPSGPKDCLKSITKRLANENPRVVLQTITLLDACINNCGRKFQLEVASRDFEQELNKIITSTRTHHKVSEKLRETLKKWSETEFKGDPELSLIPSLYVKLKGSGYDFNVNSDSPKKAAVPYSSDPNVVSTQQEEDDIAKAIQLSLQNAGSNTQSAKVHSTKQSSTISPYSGAINALSTSNDGNSSSKPELEKEPQKVRAIYDFEAAEDNELTFKAGEIVFIIDNSDPNWWKGSNHRGEGLFPANFVTTDVDAPVDEEEPVHHRTSNKRVSFSESVEVTELNNSDFGGHVSGMENAGSFPEEVVTGQVDEDKIDHLLHLIHEADPTGERPDHVGMTVLEAQVNGMAPSIDAELERIDRKHAQLARACTDLVGSMNLYHQLMREMPPPPMPYYPAYSMPGAAGPPVPQGMPPHYPPYTNPGMGPQPQHFPGQYPPYMAPTSVGPPISANYQHPHPGPGIPVHQTTNAPIGHQDPGNQTSVTQSHPSMGPGYVQFPPGPGIPPQGAPYQPNVPQGQNETYGQSMQTGPGVPMNLGPHNAPQGHGNMVPSSAPQGHGSMVLNSAPHDHGPGNMVPHTTQGHRNMVPNNASQGHMGPSSIQGQVTMAPVSMGQINMPTSSIPNNSMPFYAQPPPQSLQQPLL